MIYNAINFGPDKSQILRGFAIVSMIALHCDSLHEFKICVPLFSFLVGYGYAFAKKKNLMHGIRRSWHLLSHFWLILLGLFLPVAIWTGGYKPDIANVVLNMFGLESNLNWYSWYIYFYIFAMIIMIVASRLIARFKIIGVLALSGLCMAVCLGIHQIAGWDENIWLKAVFDCFLCSPVMFSGFYLSEGGVVTKIKLKKNPAVAIGLVILMTAIFFFRDLPLAWLVDFITVPVFAVAMVALFNIIRLNWLDRLMIALGKESMNMWFIHALFATIVTAPVFAPLIGWIEPRLLYIAVMTLVSYLIARMATAVYKTLA